MKDRKMIRAQPSSFSQRQLPLCKARSTKTATRVAEQCTMRSSNGLAFTACIFVLNKLKRIYRCYRDRDINDFCSDGRAWHQRTRVNMVEGGTEDPVHLSSSMPYAFTALHGPWSWAAQGTLPGTLREMYCACTRGWAGDVATTPDCYPHRPEGS